MNSTLLPLLPAVYDILFDFAQSDGFWANLETAFGTSYDVVKATQLLLVNFPLLQFKTLAIQGFSALIPAVPIRFILLKR